MHRGERAEARVYRCVLWVPLVLPAHSLLCSESDGLEAIYGAIALMGIMCWTAVYVPIACTVFLALRGRPLWVTRAAIAAWPMLLAAPLSPLSWGSPQWLRETLFLFIGSYGVLALVFMLALLVRWVATPRGTPVFGSAARKSDPPILVVGPRR